MNAIRRLTGVVILLGLAGCITTAAPQRYFTLDMRPSGSAKTACQVTVTRLLIAEAIDRPEIMVLASPTRIEYYAEDRWAASLRELVARKLEAELSSPGPDARPLAIEGEILDFGQADLPGGAEARVRLRLSIIDPAAERRDAVLFERTYEANTPMQGSDAAGAVEGLSRALEGIAQSVARDIAGLAPEPMS